MIERMNSCTSAERLIAVDVLPMLGLGAGEETVGVCGGGDAAFGVTGESLVGAGAKGNACAKYSGVRRTSGMVSSCLIGVGSGDDGGDVWGRLIAVSRYLVRRDPGMSLNSVSSGAENR